MPTRDEVLELLDAGHSYESAARELGVPAGQAYMIATGRPADSSETASTREPAGRPAPESPQRLVGAPPFNPTHKPHIMEWVRERAARELTHGG